MREPLDFEGLEHERNMQNFLAMEREIEEQSDRLTERIVQMSLRFGVPEEFFWMDLRENPQGSLAATLTLQARRQNIHETSAAQFMLGMNHVLDLKVPPHSHSARNPLFVNEGGQIISENDLDGGPRPSAPIDFQWKTGNVSCYGAQKYTKEGGGHQDGQYNELVRLLGNFHKHTDTGSALFVIIDGPYFDQGRVEKLKVLERTEKPRSYVLSINDLQQTLNQIVDAG